MVSRRLPTDDDLLSRLWRWLRASDLEAQAMAWAARPEVRAWLPPPRPEPRRRPSGHDEAVAEHLRVARESLAEHDRMAAAAQWAHETAHDAMHHDMGGLP